MEHTEQVMRITSSDNVSLEVDLFHPGRSMRVDMPGLLLVHGFPSQLVGAEKTGSDFPQLAGRIAEEMGWITAAIRLRGCGTSTGNFSINGWVDDARSGLEFLRSEGQPDRLWICGFGTGGAIALAAAADDPTVAGIATVGVPADFNDWAQRPKQLRDHARSLGAIKGSDFPVDFESWAEELASVSAIGAAESMGDKPLLILHGSHDEVVPLFDARALADSHGQAELHVIAGGGHLLRYDPRAIAVLLGWLDRQRSASARSV